MVYNVGVCTLKSQCYGNVFDRKVVNNYNNVPKSKSLTFFQDFLKKSKDISKVLRIRIFLRIRIQEVKILWIQRIQILSTL